ncbi:MAG: hypothetical protein QM786_17610 [Breznakibacter sp.]
MLHPIISDTDMVKAIVELLKQNNRVIVPNFGAFIISQGSNGKVLFNNFLSFNDGLLIGHLCQEKGLQKNDALIEINKFVEAIRNALETKGEYALPDLGSFTKDHHNVLRFMQDVDLYLSDHPSFETVTSPPKPTSKELLDIDTDTSFDKKEDEPPIIEIPKAKVGNKLLTIDEEKTEITAPAPVKDDGEKTMKDEPVRPGRTASSTPRQDSSRYYKPESAYKGKNEQSEKKGRPLGWFVFIFVLIPILALVGYVGFYQDRFGWVGMLKNLMVSEKTAEPVNVPAQSEEQPKEQAKPIQSESQSPATFQSNFRYHIIVSTKNNEADAKSYANGLREKGFANTVVIPRKGKFLVSIDGANDLVEVEARQEEIVNTYRIESYVLLLK